MHRVVVFPMSGYGNRFQAIASAGLIAKELNAEFTIAWEQQPVCPVPATDIFGAEFCASFVRSAEQVGEELGIWRENIPRYLNVDSRNMMVTLAGHDHGEQAHMHALSRVLDAVGIGYTLVFVAGGNFAFQPTDEDDAAWRKGFTERRGAFYAGMPLHPAIEADARQQIAEHPESWGLHLRYTDREHQAPFTHAITRALRTLRERNDIQSLFIAGDSARVRDIWFDRTRKCGFSPWMSTQQTWDRSSASSAHGALVDWRILSATRGAVFFSESTFAIEALAAGGVIEASIGLPAHPLRSAWVRSRALARAGVTYPKRHGWWGKSTR